ncbi:MAG: M20 family metallopeptidase [bacterium]
MNVPTKTLQIPHQLQSIFPKKLQSRLVALRRDLHQHPELSFREERTAQKLYDELALLQPAELDRIAGTGVVARIKGRDSNAPKVAVRGDIDALPIQEQTGLEFASVTPCVMHACGHDVHAAWVVGVAHLLKEKPAEGDVLIVLQPAEEIGKGCLAILQSGILDDVSAIFGAHVDQYLTVGRVVAQEGPLAASADTFEIELVGRGAHGARPHESVDPVVGVGALITALQTIVSRRLNPAHAGVVTIGTVNAGSAPNIIPESAKLTGTLRSVDSKTRQFLQDELREVAESTAAAYHLRAEIKVEPGTPALVNPAQPVSWSRQAVSSLLGEEALAQLGFSNMAGEDFAFYLEKIPGCFIRIGARELGAEPIPAHSPYFYPAEESIFVGAAVLAETARIASLELGR